MQSCHTSNWSPLGPDVFYRRVSLYHLDWCTEYDIHLERHQVISSPFAGVIALAEKSTKTNALCGNVYVFSSSGQFISVLKDVAESICLLFFTREENLVSVALDGQVCIYELKGTLKRSYIIDPDVRQQGIHEATTFISSDTTGIAVLTKQSRFFIVKDVNAPKVDKCPLLPDPSLPSSWCVISESGDPSVIVAQESMLLHVTSKRCMPTSIDFKDTEVKSIVKMCSSMRGNNVALATDSQTLWFGQVTEDALMQTKTEFNPKSNSDLIAMSCAGPEAVITVWKDRNETDSKVLLALVLGFDDYFFSLFLNQPLHLVQEIDGVRVISNDTHELIEFVPQVVVNIHRIGSVSAGCLLLSASKEYDKKSYKADEYLKVIRDRKDYVQCVKECIEAAAHEYYAPDQKLLLEAALLGKRLTPTENRDMFVDCCKQLRVLNEVRKHEAGIPITFKQFQQLGLDALVDRLIARGKYSIAVNICNFLEVRKERGVLRILRKWATERVHESDFDDDATADKIRTKLGPRPGISYSDIAEEAVRRGRKLLAIKLLDYEVKASKQIPLLLLLEQHRTAIEKAIDSMDPHLLYSVIQKLQRQFPEREFRDLMMKYPPAMLILRKTSPLTGTLHSILDGDDAPQNAMAHLKAGVSDTNPNNAIKSLQNAASLFKKMKQDFAASVIEADTKLIRLQTRLKEKSHFDCEGLSVSDTIRALVRDNQHRLAEDVRKDFKVSEKRFWWIKIKVLIDKKDWMELDKFSKSKKSPIGYEPFVDSLLKAGDRSEAARYVQRVDPQLRVTYFVKLGLLDEAAQFAYERDNMEWMDYVMSKSGPTQRSRIEPLRRKMLQAK